MSRINTEVKIEKRSTIPNGAKNAVKGFADFMNKYSILTMAIGVIIGQTTKDTVNVLVSGIITPALQLLTPNTELQDLVIKAGKAEFKIGLFINSFIEMLIIMLLLYIVIAVIFRRKDLLEKKKTSKVSSKKTKKK
ncbi:MscL family protein [Candidatus Dojkabacteria bacterium]|nr:MscL family protein [Candidatus Dojkabacteria bacterium]